MPKPILTILCLLCTVGAAFAFWPRPWERGAWDAADHDRNGVLTRAEMQQFSTQKPHRNAGRLMMHFDRADTNSNGLVSGEEIEAYGTEIGSQDPFDHLPADR